jgi:hypothetical protein
MGVILAPSLRATRPLKSHEISIFDSVRRVVAPYADSSANAAVRATVIPILWPSAKISKTNKT